MGRVPVRRNCEEPDRMIQSISRYHRKAGNPLNNEVKNPQINREQIKRDRSIFTPKVTQLLRRQLIMQGRVSQNRQHSIYAEDTDRKLSNIVDNCCEKNITHPFQFLA